MRKEGCYIAQSAGSVCQCVGEDIDAQAQGVGVISWFQRRVLRIQGNNFNNTLSTVEPSASEINTNGRIYFLTFGTDQIRGDCAGGISNNSANVGTAMYLQVDASGDTGQSIGFSGLAVGVGINIPSYIVTNPSEGQHYVNAWGYVSSTSTADFSGLKNTVTVQG